jgi:hypothetical protein
MTCVTDLQDMCDTSGSTIYLSPRRSAMMPLAFTSYGWRDVRGVPVRYVSVERTRVGMALDPEAYLRQLPALADSLPEGA